MACADMQGAVSSAPSRHERHNQLDLPLLARDCQRCAPAREALVVNKRFKGAHVSTLLAADTAYCACNTVGGCAIDATRCNEHASTKTAAHPLLSCCCSTPGKRSWSARASDKSSMPHSTATCTAYALVVGCLRNARSRACSLLRSSCRASRSLRESSAAHSFSASSLHIRRSVHRTNGHTRGTAGPAQGACAQTCITTASCFGHKLFATQRRQRMSEHFLPRTCFQTQGCAPYCAECEQMRGHAIGAVHHLFELAHGELTVTALLLCDQCVQLACASLLPHQYCMRLRG